MTRPHRVPRQHPTWTVRLPDMWGEALPRLRPGVLDDIARQVYLRGQTAFLALALHDRTGGQIWGALCRRTQSGQPSPVPGHFAVEIEPGVVLDIDGSRALSEWSNLQGAQSVPLSREELREWQRKHQPSRQWMGRTRSHQAQYRLAESFVELLLRQ
jgi:hypothetical protein